MVIQLLCSFFSCVSSSFSSPFLLDKELTRLSCSLVEQPYLLTAPTLPLSRLSHLVAAKVFPPFLIPGVKSSPPLSPPFRAGHVTTTTSDGLILTCGGQNYYSCLALDVSASTWRNHSTLDSLRHYSSHALLPPRPLPPGWSLLLLLLLPPHRSNQMGGWALLARDDF